MSEHPAGGDAPLEPSGELGSAPGPTHPAVRAAALMVGVVVVITLLALLGTGAGP